MCFYMRHVFVDYKAILWHRSTGATYLTARWYPLKQWGRGSSNDSSSQECNDVRWLLDVRNKLNVIYRTASRRRLAFLSSQPNHCLEHCCNWWVCKHTVWLQEPHVKGTKTETLCLLVFIGTRQGCLFLTTPWPAKVKMSGLSCSATTAPLWKKEALLFNIMC